MEAISESCRVCTHFLLSCHTRLCFACPSLALGLFLHGGCCLHCMGNWDGLGWLDCMGGLCNGLYSPTALFSGSRTGPLCHLWDAAWSPALLSQPPFPCSGPVTVLPPLTWPCRAAGEGSKSGRGMGVSSLHQGCFRKWKGSGLSTSFPPSFPPIPCSLWGSVCINPQTLSPKAHDPEHCWCQEGALRLRVSSGKVQTYPVLRAEPINTAAPLWQGQAALNRVFQQLIQLLLQLPGAGVPQLPQLECC